MNQESILHFDNLDLGVHLRTAVKDDKAYFGGKDICDSLQISDYKQALASLDEDELLTLTPDSLRGCNTPPLDLPNRGLQFVTESGLYALIFKSRKPEAKKFRKWVTSEVLPAIRRHGRYDPAALPAALPPEARAAYLLTEADALLSRSNYLRHEAECAVIVPGQITVLEFLRKHGIGLTGAAVGRLSSACKLRADQRGITSGFSRSATVSGRRVRLSRPARTYPEDILAEVCIPT